MVESQFLEGLLIVAYEADALGRVIYMGRGPTCSAKTHSGKKCAKPAGWGTDHVGNGPCKYHGGGFPAVRRQAAKPALDMLVGYDVGPVDPWDALLMCVRITASEVAYYSLQIGQLEERQIIESMIWGPNEIKQANIWMRLRSKAVSDLARYSKMAIDAGVAERQVHLAEQMGDVLARLVDGVISDLRLTKEQQQNVPGIVRRHLALVAGGTAG